MKLHADGWRRNLVQLRYCTANAVSRLNMGHKNSDLGSGIAWAVILFVLAIVPTAGTVIWALWRYFVSP